ncbi:MAG: DEAD/DEAH box helicase [Thermoleophilia bacterium]|nr:DEAD/DEAH box helicase [Thermoleophilia bacterium]
MPDSPTSPTTATASLRFADMPEVHHHVAGALAKEGIVEAFPIQVAVVPPAAAGKDVLVRSPTGSGKTLAFGLAIIAQIERAGDRPKAVILVPTRELAVQVRNDLTAVAWSRQIKVAAAFGGMPIAKQAKLAAIAPIIIATPGRLADLVARKMVNLDDVEMLVLDEADRMLDMGFGPDVETIADGLVKRRQTMLFSATLDGRVAKIAKKYLKNPQTHEVDEAPGAGGKLDHQLVATTPAAKVNSLLTVLEDPRRGQVIAFVKTQQNAEQLKAALLEHGLRATAIHGAMTQQDRLLELRRMQDGTCDVLATTDIFARGMDLANVTHVVNFDLPEDPDAYHHRAGRTGRAGRAGTVVTLVEPKQRAVVESLLLDAGLPSSLFGRMRETKTVRHETVPEQQRYVREPGKAQTKDVQRGRARAAGNGNGVVSGYDRGKGFGFIEQVGGGKDVFFHRSTLDGIEHTFVHVGLEVQFTLEPGAGKKLRAKTVKRAGA